MAFRIQRSVAGQARRGGRYALPIVLVCLVELLGLATLLPWTAETDRPVILGDIAAAGALALPTCLGVALRATRRAHPAAACALVGLPLVGIVGSFALALGNPEHSDLGRVLPNPLLYSAHALMGGVVDELGGPPQYAAVQWAKAASHAGGLADVSQAADGIARARARSADARVLDGVLCGIDEHGSPNVREAFARASLRCD